MKINNRVYDALKYLAQVGLPALATFVFTIGPIWDMPNTDEISQSIIATNVLLGALLLINQVKWNNSDEKYDGTIDPYLANAITPDEALYLPEMDRRIHENGTVEVTQKDVLLKVEQPNVQ